MSYFVKTPNEFNVLLIWTTNSKKTKFFCIKCNRFERFLLMDVGNKFLDDKELSKKDIENLKLIKSAILKPNKKNIDNSEDLNKFLKKVKKKSIKKSLKNPPMKKIEESINLSRSDWYKFLLKTNRIIDLMDCPISLIVSSGSKRPDYPKEEVIIKKVEKIKQKKVKNEVHNRRKRKPRKALQEGD